MDVHTANVALLPSENGECKVVCYENVKLTHSISVENGTLTITIPTNASVEVLGEASKNGTLTVELEAGGKYLIVFSAENEQPFMVEIDL